MQEKLEQILKEIHILFSKGTAVPEVPDQIVVNKRALFSLLEKLNQAVYEMMDQYEVTVLSKERAKMELEKQQQERIEETTKISEDIYAASLMFTDNSLLDIQDIMKKTKESIQKEYKEMEQKIDEQVAAMVQNQIELKQQMSELMEGEKYLKLIQEENKRKKKEKEELEQQKKQQNVGTPFIRNRGQAAGIKKELPDMAEPVNSKRLAAERAIAVSDSYIEEDTLPPEKKEIVVKVNEWYGKENNKKMEPGILEEKTESMSKKGENVLSFGSYKAEDFDLDSEYEEWKKEIEVDASEEKPEKKKRSFFGKKQMYK